MIDAAPIFMGLVLAQVSPGPNMMAVASASLGSSRGTGIATAAGIATGAFLWGICLAPLVGALLGAFPQALTAMRFLGGGYLLYLGLKSLRAALAPSSPTAAVERSSVTAGSAYRRGLLVVLTNPKAALMWIAITLYLASVSLSMVEHLVFALCGGLSALLIYGAYALLFSTGVAVRAYGRFFRLIEGCFGALFGMVGVRVVLDGIRGLRA